MANKKSQKERKKEINGFYFDTWLMPNTILNKKDYYNCWDTKERLIYMLDYIDKSKLKKFVDKMSYKDYLSTSYWKFVSYLVKKKAKNKCQLCNSNISLNVHHRTYEHKGYEINYLEDLTVLCEKCHQKFHEVI